MNKPIPVKFDGLNQMIWDASSLDSALQCPRLYRNSVVRKLRWRHGTKQSTTWGSAYHKGQEIFHENLCKDETRDFALEAAIYGAIEYGRENGILDSEDNARTLDTLARSLVWYEDRYRNDPLSTYVFPDGTPGLEFRFEVPIPGTNKRLSGRVDRLVHFEGQIYPLDFKSTEKALNEFYFRQFKPNIQGMVYPWALRQFFDAPIPGLIIDACQTGVTFNRFERSTFYYSDWELEEFEENLKRWVIQFEQYALENYFPKNPTACLAKSASGCIFLKACCEGPFEEDWLSEDFIVVEKI